VVRLLALATLVPSCVVRGGACRTGRFPPTDSHADPFPNDGVVTFGDREGEAHALSDDDPPNDVCPEYKRNLENASTSVVRRHNSVMFMNDNACLVTKFKPGPPRKARDLSLDSSRKNDYGSSEDFELHWIKSFSGMPHFMTMLASHALPNCQVMVLVNEWDDNWHPDWSMPWSFYREQTDVMAKTIREQGCVPKDVSVSQIMNVGGNLTIIDYEYWVPLPARGAEEREREEQFQTSTLYRLQLDVWRNWLFESGNAGRNGLPISAVQKVLGVLHDALPVGELEYLGRVMRPMQVEGPLSSADSITHCSLRRHLQDAFAPSASTTVKVAGVGVAQGMVLSTPKYISASVQPVVTAMGGKVEVHELQFDPAGDVTDILKMDIVIFQMIVSAAEPEPSQKWGAELLSMLNQSNARSKPSVIVVFAWNGNSSWPQQPTWSLWHREQLEHAKAYNTEGGIDVSILGTWFRKAAYEEYDEVNHASAGIDVATTNRSIGEDPQAKRTAEVLQLFLSSQVLTPVPLECLRQGMNIVGRGGGVWGGACTCPDGTVYQVSEQVSSDTEECTLNCAGGVSGQCHKHDGKWGHTTVTCAPQPAAAKGEGEGGVGAGSDSEGNSGGKGIAEGETKAQSAVVGVAEEPEKDTTSAPDTHTTLTVQARLSRLEVAVSGAADVGTVHARLDKLETALGATPAGTSTMARLAAAEAALG
jgi:hypothetical protein